MLTGKWFNGGYLADIFAPGQRVSLFGKVEFDSYTGHLAMMHPEYEILSSGDEEARPAMEIVDANPDPEASYLQGEEAQILSAAMRQLRPRMRKAIELREIAELSNRDVAAHLGVSIGAVKARVFHARRKLAVVLRDQMRPRRVSRNGISIFAESGGRTSQDRLTCAWS